MALVTDRKEEDQLFHVLVVDDNLFDRIILKALLALLSFHVTCVESAHKALEYIGLLDTATPPPPVSGQEVKVNLIMTDYCMPGMSGYDLLVRVKKSSWKDVPVVVMSSENVSSRINMCLEGGAEEFLLKPVKTSDLQMLLPRLLKSLRSSSPKPKGSISNKDDPNDNNDCDDDTKNNNGNKKMTISTTEPSLEERQPKVEGSTVL